MFFCDAFHRPPSFMGHTWLQKFEGVLPGRDWLTLLLGWSVLLKHCHVLVRALLYHTLWWGLYILSWVSPVAELCEDQWGMVLNFFFVCFCKKKYLRSFIVSCLNMEIYWVLLGHRHMVSQCSSPTHIHVGLKTKCMSLA